MVYATLNNNTPFYLFRGIIESMETKEKETRHGLIAPGKVRINLVIPRDLKAALEKAAADQQRSMSNYIVTILTAAMQQTQGRPQDKSK